MNTTTTDVGGVPASRTASRTSRVWAARFGLAALGLVPGTLKLLQHLVENLNLDACHAGETRATTQAGAGKRTSHGYPRSPSLWSSVRFA
jgi:hypothetical protein